MEPTYHYLAVVSGGLGPNTWDKEVEVDANDIRQAVDMVESQIIESGAAIISIEQVD